MNTPSTEHVTSNTTEHEEAWPNPRYAWYVVIVLTIAYTISFIDRQIISLLVGPIQADLGINDFQISLLQGIAFASFYTLLGLPIGRLADKSNRRNLVAWGIFFWSLMTVACGLAKNFTQLFFARMGVGVGEATISPCSYSMISDYFPKEKLSRALSIYFMGVYLGSGLAFIAGGAVIQMVAAAGQVSIPVVGEINAWQATFIAVGLPGLFYTLLMFTVKEPKRRGLMKRDEDGSTDVTMKQALGFMFKRWRIYIMLSAGLGFHSMLGYAAASWVPEYFIRTFGTGRADIAYIYGFIILFAATAGVYSGGWLGDYLESKGHKDAKFKTMLIGLGCLLPFGILFPLMPTENSAIIMLTFAAYFKGYPYGVSAAAIQVITPNQMRGLVTAGYLFVMNIIGMGFGPAAVGFLTTYVFLDPSKVGLALSISAAFTIPLGIMFIALARKPYLRGLDQVRH